ncbi:hypothetical protein GA0115240_172210, partial [Streptomyces sp. DvalAA-14]
MKTSQSPLPEIVPAPANVHPTDAYGRTTRRLGRKTSPDRPGHREDWG